MAILFFVGCDKTGKSTLFRSVLNKTNRHICIDRFTACQYVYGKYHGKEDTPTVGALRSIETTMCEAKAAFIHVEADVFDIADRFNLHNEKDININHVSKVMEDYREYLAETPLPVFTINTSGKSIDECTEDIIRFGDTL